MFKTRKSELMLLITTLIWGGTFPSIKVALDYVSPVLLMGLRFALASLLFIVIMRPCRSAFSHEVLKKGLALGVLMFFGYGLQTIGLKYTDAARSGFLTYFYALLTPFFQLFILKKKPLPANLAGLLIAFGGLSLVTGIGAGGGALNKGDLITLLSAVSFSLYVVCINLWSSDEDAAALTLLQMMTAALLSLGISPLVEKAFINPEPLFWLNLIYLSLLGSVVAVFLMNRFQNAVTPTRAVILYSLEPVFSAFIAILLLRESFTPLQILGSALIISGVLLSEILDIRREALQQS
jgi:drug/metabolite transporter (DMT)-like permease